MKKSEILPTDSSTLRHLAEERLSEKNIPVGSVLHEDPRGLIHELQVYQIELEAQNEELRSAWAASDEKETLLGKYSDLYDSAPVGYFTLNNRCIIRAVNLTGAGFLGGKRSSLIGQRLDAFISNETRSGFLGFLEKVFASNKNQSCEVILLKEGSPPIYAQVEASVSASRDECRAIIVDITELKRAEAVFRESERRYSSLFDKTTNGIAHCMVVTDESGQPVDYWIMRVNEAYERIIGVKKSCIEGRRVKEIFPDFEKNAFDYVGVLGKVALEGGEATFEAFLEETQQYLSIYAYCPLPGEFTAILTDVTERRRAEDELRASEQLHRAILHTARDGFWMVDMQGRLLEVNLAYCRMSGYSEQELLCMRVTELEALETASDTAEHIRRVINQGAERFESSHRRKDGSRFEVEVSLQYQPVGGGRIVSFLRDISTSRRADSERTNLEAQLRHAEDESKVMPSVKH